MALLENLLKSETSKGVAIGIASAVLTPIILPALIGVARPLARAAIKGGIVLYEKTRETAAEAGEIFEDLVAEAQSELEQERAHRAQEASQASQQAAPEAEKPEKPASGE
jgi:hypothetical protein